MDKQQAVFPAKTTPTIPAMRTATLNDYKQRMLHVLVHIQANLDAPLPLDKLARQANFSPFHFHRVFKGMLGESVQSHVRRLRLERAAWRLKLSRQSVTDIAFEAGYETHEAFTRAFGSAFGMPPSRYRALNAIRADGVVVTAPSGVHYSADAPLKQFKTRRPGDKNMQVIIKTIAPMRVAFVRHVGPYDQCGRAWEKLCTFLGKEGLLAGVQFIGVSHDDPEVTPPDRIRYDACVTVDESFQPQGEIGVQTIVGGDYAVTAHIGPYNRLNETYSKLMGQWLPRHGRELRSTPCFEVYLNDPESTDPKDLLTDVHVPLEP